MLFYGRDSSHDTIIAHLLTRLVVCHVSPARIRYCILREEAKKQQTRNAMSYPC
jgi:hypothetical protein